MSLPDPAGSACTFILCWRRCVHLFFTSSTLPTGRECQHESDQPSLCLPCFLGGGRACCPFSWGARPVALHVAYRCHQNPLGNSKLFLAWVPTTGNRSRTAGSRKPLPLGFLPNHPLSPSPLMALCRVPSARCTITTINKTDTFPLLMSTVFVFCSLSRALCSQNLLLH